MKFSKKAGRVKRQMMFDYFDSKEHMKELEKAIVKNRIKRRNKQIRRENLVNLILWILFLISFYINILFWIEIL